MDISETGLQLIESFEGYSYHAYWDSYGGVWTVGYGETQGVGPNTTMTRAQAEADLRDRLIREYEPAIKDLGVPLNQNQFDALCSFVWNVGPGSMQWDVGRYLRERNYQAAANAMLEYDRAGGVVLAGLVRRREAERALFLKPPVPPPDPLHYDRFADISFSFNNGRNHINERNTVMEYDKLRPDWRKNHDSLVLLRLHMQWLATRILIVAHYQDSPHWDWYWRGWRWWQLAQRGYQAKRMV